jgi:hypothetical protein
MIYFYKRHFKRIKYGQQQQQQKYERSENLQTLGLANLKTVRGRYLQRKNTSVIF